MSASKIVYGSIGTRKSFLMSDIVVATPNPRLAGNRVVLSRIHPDHAAMHPVIFAFAKT
jgi:hypothetical protein